MKYGHLFHNTYLNKRIIVMNESTSYFIYALVRAHVRSPLWVLLQDAKWKEQISDLNFSDFLQYGEALLVKGIYAPGYQNTPKVINTKLIDVKLFNDAYGKIDRKENIFNELTSTFQPGAVKPSTFNIKKMSLTEILHGEFRQASIPPRTGTSSVSILHTNANMNKNNNCYIPVNENLSEELELVYRGSWFTPLWVYLYEKHKGSSMFVEFDCDVQEYYHAFELHSGLRVSSLSEEKLDDNFTKATITGYNLDVLAKLLDEIKMHGNVGHSFTWYINKTDFKNYDSRQCFDGDGPDYIKRISLTKKTK